MGSKPTANGKNKKPTPTKPAKAKLKSKPRAGRAKKR